MVPRLQIRSCGPTIAQPRTDLSKLAGDSSAVVVIKGIGSYYLTADLPGAAGKNTIHIATAGRVTIDLNGFALTATGADKSAIALPGANDAIVIRNGTILATGGTATRAISGDGNRVICEDLAVIGNTGVDLIALGTDSAVRRCWVAQGGITLGDRGTVSDSIVLATTDASIRVGHDGSVTGVTFTANRGGLTVGDRGKIADCQVKAAGPSTSFGSAGTVVQAGFTAIVRRCTVSARARWRAMRSASPRARLSRAAA